MRLGIHGLLTGSTRLPHMPSQTISHTLSDNMMNPDVSVIIPVGPNHENTVFESLDSLESQTHRNWEGIVVWDSPNTDNLQKTKRCLSVHKGNRDWWRQRCWLCS